jgi:SAM-dependent methyltransferase
MPANALRADRRATPPGATHDASGAPEAALRALLAEPEDRTAVDAFQAVAHRFDPGAPRDETLNAALIAALSMPDVDAAAAQDLAQRSLCAELSSARAPGEPSLRLPPATVSLIAALLHHRINTSLPLESALIDLRQSLLDFAQTTAEPGAQRRMLAEAMARHSFANEFLWPETGAETEAVAALENRVRAALAAGAEVSAFDLFVLGAYRPLDRVDAIGDWLRALGRHASWRRDPTLRLLVYDRMDEDAQRIEALTPMASPVSAEVGAQYEENPYPRWRHLRPAPRFDGVGAYAAAMLGRPRSATRQAPARQMALIAGAGTGRHPINVAQALPDAAVLAIDLSRASLAYAAREAEARGVENIAFAQADILALSGVDLAFDLIESVGVLHHMADPEAGLRALVGLLKPGGVMRLGFYSKTARRAVTLARHRFGSETEPGIEGIRRMRSAVIAAREPALAPLMRSQDFFTASAFRDLVMHVREHQFTLPEIDAMLKRNGLKFLGFCNRAATAAQRRMPPATVRRIARDLKAWDRLEQRQPETFEDMYEFFCVLR